MGATATQGRTRPSSCQSRTCPQPLLPLHRALGPVLQSRRPQPLSMEIWCGLWFCAKLPLSFLAQGKRNLSLHTPYIPSVRNGHVSSGQDLPHLPHHSARAGVQGEGTWHSWNWCDGAGARPDGAGPSRHSPRSAELAVNRDREGPLGLPREADTERFTGGKQVASTLGTECAHAPRRKPAPRGCH